MMIRYGVPRDDALDVCERLPETFTEFLADIGTLERRGASDSAISPSGAVKTPEKHDAPHAGAGAA